jgi:hypothetical protein
MSISESNPALFGLSPTSPSPSPTPKTEPLFVTEYFEVRPSPRGGFGAFAVKDIPKDTVVIMETALFSGTMLEVFHLYEQLSKEQRKEYMKLHAHMGVGGHRILSIFKTNR